MVIMEEVVVRWGWQVGRLWLLLWEEEVLLVKWLLLLDLAEVGSRKLAGEVDSLQGEGGAEEKEEEGEGEGGSKPATGLSQSIIIKTFPRNCPVGPHQWCISALARR